MKIWPLLIGIIVLLAIGFSPVLAISKSDLISYYKGQSTPAMPPPTPEVPSKGGVPAYLCGSCIQPAVIPTSAPTQAPSGTEFLKVCSSPGGAMVYLDGKFKGLSPLTLTGLSPGSHQIRVVKFGYSDYSTDVIILEGRSCWGNMRPYPGCENWLPCVTLEKSIIWV